MHEEPSARPNISLNADARLWPLRGPLVPLFYLQIGDKHHAVHFPYLSAILAGHEQEHRKQLWTFWIWILALVLSVASLAVNFYKR